MKRYGRRWAFLAFGLAFFVLTTPGRASEKSYLDLSAALSKLSRSVNAEEAKRVAENAYLTAAKLKTEWRMVSPANLQNFLIHIGARKRGLCFQWAHGIGSELKKLPLSTLELHWAEAYPNTQREHNVLVVTARGFPISTGYVLDGWRASGRLVWIPVNLDKYPWRENIRHTRWLQNRGPDPLKVLDEPL